MRFFSFLQTTERNKDWYCQNVCGALSYLLDNICIRFSNKLYRQIVGIQIDRNCAPLVADLFLFCYERYFMASLSDENQANIIEALNSTSRYLDDVLDIDNPYFEGMVNQIYPLELQLNKATTQIQIPRPLFWIYFYLFLTVLFPPKFMINAMTDFDIVHFPFLDDDVQCRPSCLMECIFLNL